MKKFSFTSIKPTNKNGYVGHVQLVVPRLLAKDEIIKKGTHITIKSGVYAGTHAVAFVSQFNGSTVIILETKGGKSEELDNVFAIGQMSPVKINFTGEQAAKTLTIKEKLTSKKTLFIVGAIVGVVVIGAVVYFKCKKN